MRDAVGCQIFTDKHIDFDVYNERVRFFSTVKKKKTLNIINQSKTIKLLLLRLKPVLKCDVSLLILLITKMFTCALFPHTHDVCESLILIFSH